MEKEEKKVKRSKIVGWVLAHLVVFAVVAIGYSLIADYSDSYITAAVYLLLNTAWVCLSVVRATYRRASRSASNKALLRHLIISVVGQTVIIGLAAASCFGQWWYSPLGLLVLAGLVVLGVLVHDKYHDIKQALAFAVRFPFGGVKRYLYVVQPDHSNPLEMRLSNSWNDLMNDPHFQHSLPVISIPRGGLLFGRAKVLNSSYWSVRRTKLGYGDKVYLTDSEGGCFVVTISDMSNQYSDSSRRVADLFNSSKSVWGFAFYRQEDRQADLRRKISHLDELCQQLKKDARRQQSSLETDRAQHKHQLSVAKREYEAKIREEADNIVGVLAYISALILKIPHKHAFFGRAQAALKNLMGDLSRGSSDRWRALRDREIEKLEGRSKSTTN